MNITLNTNLSISLSLMHELGAEIVCGRYTSENFPTEAELFQSLSISRGVVREALKMLESKGMIISKQNQGVVLRSANDWNLLDADVLSWILDNPNVDLIRELLQFQMTIEAAAASLVAQSCSRATDLQSMPLILQKLENPSLSTEQITKEVANFHTAILSASRNSFFCSLKKIAHISAYASSRFISQPKAAELMIYPKIYHAIISGNGSLANSAVYDLLETILASLSEKNM